MRVVRSGRAGRDLDDIFDHTARRWGADQAERYLRELDAACQRLAEYPLLGSAADLVRPGYRRLASGRHVIYFRVHPDEVLIVRVLHQRMDAGRHFSGVNAEGD